MPYGPSFWQVGGSSEQNGAHRVQTRLVNKEGVIWWSLALCQEHGKIPLLAFAQTRTQLLSKVGHHSIIIVCFILKLQQHDGRVVKNEKNMATAVMTTTSTLMIYSNNVTVASFPTRSAEPLPRTCRHFHSFHHRNKELQRFSKW